MQTIPQLLDSLTVLRDIRQSMPAVCLRDLCASVRAANYDDAVNDYCALTSELLGDYRRVTGNIWKDFLFSMLFESPNRYAVNAAQGKLDPALRLAVTMDLRALHELFSLDSEEITTKIRSLRGFRTAADRERAKKRVSSEESIIHTAASAWAGKMNAVLQKPELVNVETDAADVLGQPLPQWKYDEPAAHWPPYAADEGLAVIYRRFIAEKDWGQLTEELRRFHARYGTADYLRCRTFLANDEGIHGIETPSCADFDQLVCIDAQKAALCNNTAGFLSGRGCCNVLLYGEGSGKTSSVCALCAKFPELRLVYVNCRDLESCAERVKELGRQPLRFVALMDDLAIRDFEYRRLKAAFGHVDAPNVMLVMTSRTRLSDDALFPLQLNYPTLDFEAFCSAVESCAAGIDRELVLTSCEALRAQGVDLTGRVVFELASSLIAQQHAQSGQSSEITGESFVNKSHISE